MYWFVGVGGIKLGKNFDVVDCFFVDYVGWGWLCGGCVVYCYC